MTSKKKKKTPAKSPQQKPEKESENSQPDSKKQSENFQSQSAPSDSSPSDSSPSDSVSQSPKHDEVEVEPETKSSSEAAPTENEKKANPGDSKPTSEPDDETEAVQGSIFGALLGKMLSTGESQIKRAAELKLPREIINFSKEQMKGLKHDMVKTVGSEVSHFLKNLNLGKELVKVLTYLTFEVKMQIRLVPSDENKLKLKPESKIKVVSKKNKKPKVDEPQK